MKNSISTAFRNRLFQLFSWGSYGLQLTWHLKHLIPRRGKFLFIACMPKSGSTFLTNTLSELTGFRKTNLTYAFERNDQNLYLPKLVDCAHLNTVTHQHIRATDSNLMLMQKFALRPVILTRNIFDVVVSIRDHFHNESYKFPTAYCDKKFFELDQKTQFDFIIDLALPWYFNFYVSWYKAAKSNLVETLWLTYDEAVINWEKTLLKTISFYKISKTKEEIQTALNRNLNKKNSQNRINKGIVGRGKKTLTLTQQNKIISYARFYPDVEFSPIGIYNSSPAKNAHEKSPD